ncbi:MAG: AraC family transcriptional regulator [Ferruginibacter sp.]
MKTALAHSASGIYPPTVIKAIRNAQDLMNADLKTHLVLRNLARRVGTNEFTLKKGFKEVFNTTVYQYLLKQRMNKAFILVTSSNLKLKEIAAQCGFETLSGFSTSFTKYYGIRPGGLR